MSKDLDLSPIVTPYEHCLQAVEDTLKLSAEDLAALGCKTPAERIAGILWREMHNYYYLGRLGMRQEFAELMGLKRDLG